MTAAKGNSGVNSEYVSLILDKSPSTLNAVDKFGRTALHHCVISAGEAIKLQMLIDSNIDRNITDVYGKKAVYYTQFCPQK